MSMESSHSVKTATVHIGDRLSEAFKHFEDKIRERAYHLSLSRQPHEADPLNDWLEAEAELSEPAHLEVKEQKKNTVVEVKLKDFTPEEIEVEVADNVLRIFGSHTEKTTQDKKKKSGSTTRTKTFFHAVPLSNPVNVERSHAKLLKNGKLKVVLAND